MINRDDPQGPGQGPLDEPDRDPGDPIGDNAYPGGGTMTPPTGDMDDPIPETGMHGEPELDAEQPRRDEGVGPDADDRP
jgi:hypothetical protein